MKAPEGRDQYRFDARYGRLIRKAGIGTVPFALFFYQGELALQPQEVWFIAYILAHRWSRELPYPALSEMARRAGLTRKCLQGYRASLEAKGFLVVEERTRANGGQSSNGYDFSPLLERLDACISRDRAIWERRNPAFLEDEGEDDVAIGSTVSAPPVPPPRHRAVAGEGEPAVAGGRHRALAGRRHRMGARPAQAGGQAWEEDTDEADTGEKARRGDLAELWQSVLGDLAEQVLPSNYSRWLARTTLLALDGGEAVVGAPDAVCVEQLARRLDPLVRRSLADAHGGPVSVRYTIVERRY